MEKKQYIIPSVEQWLLSTVELMKASEGSPNVPPGPGSAPRREPEVF